MFEYINKYYGLDCKLNQVILFGDQKMVIEGVEGAYLKCWDYSKNRYVTLHPTWNVQYTDEIDNPKIPESKKRYKKYLESNSDLSFGEWLKEKRYE